MAGGVSGHHLHSPLSPTTQSTPSPSADLLGLRAAPPPAAPPAPAGAGNLLVDVFSDGPATQPSLGPTPEDAFLRYCCHGPRAPPLPPSPVPLYPPAAPLDSLVPLPCPSPPQGLSLLLLLSFPLSFSPSSLFHPLAASLGLAACHACLLLSALVLDGPASWSRLPPRAPWLCWLIQLRLLSKGVWAGVDSCVSREGSGIWGSQGAAEAMIWIGGRVWVHWPGVGQHIYRACSCEKSYLVLGFFKVLRGIGPRLLSSPLL